MATVNATQATRGVLDAFEKAGFGRKLSFTNKNSGNDVYILTHVAE